MQGRASAGVKGCWPSLTPIQQGEASQSRDDLSWEIVPRPGKSRMAAVAVSLVTLDRCFDIREGHSRSATIRVGPDVQPLHGVKLYV